MGKNLLWLVFWIAAILLVIGGVSWIMNNSDIEFYTINNNQQETGASSLGGSPDSLPSVDQTVNSGTATSSSSTNSNTNTQSATNFTQITDPSDVAVIEYDIAIDTKSAQNVDDNRALLRGFVDSGQSGNVEVWFEWDTSRNDVSDGDGRILNVNGRYDTGASFEKYLYGLNDDRRYYYRACGEDQNGHEDCGTVKNFRTDESPNYSSSSGPNYTIPEYEEPAPVVVDETVTINLGDTVAIANIAIKLASIYDTCEAGACADLEFRQGSTLDAADGVIRDDVISTLGYTITAYKVSPPLEKVLLRVQN